MATSIIDRYIGDNDSDELAGVIPVLEDNTPTSTQAAEPDSEINVYTNSSLPAFAKRLGYTQTDYTRLHNAISGYNPNTDGSILDLYNKYKPAPVEPVPTQQGKKLNSAAIGDAAATGIEVLAGLIGARRRPRNTAVNYIAAQAQNKEDNNKYIQLQDIYTSGQFNAGVQDLLNRRKLYEDSLAERRWLAGQMLADEQAAARLAAQKAKEEADKAFKAAEGDKNRQTTIRAAGIRRSGGSGTPRENPYRIEVNANPNNPNAQTDAFGGRVATYSDSQAQMRRLVESAMADAEFIKQNPDLYTTSGYGRAQQRRWTSDNRRIAQAYAQWQEDGRYPTEQPTITVPTFVPGFTPAPTTPVQPNPQSNSTKTYTLPKPTGALY